MNHRVVDKQAILDAVEAQSRRVTPGIDDIAAYLSRQSTDKSHREVIGPLLPGRGASGVILYSGELIAQWGDPCVPEMLFSATKSLVSTVAGVAFDRGLIRDLDEPVACSAHLPEFSTGSGRLVTWTHLLQQTSNWEGVLWDKPASADEQSRRPGSAPPGTLPGQGWAYNDVRVNLLCLGLTTLFGAELSTVLEEEILAPLGFKGPWAWHGYQNAYLRIAGRDLPVVSCGAHWGGGAWMPANDLALVGQLYIQNGYWRGQQLLSRAWIQRTFQACPHNPAYGYLWWINAGLSVCADAPSTGRCARGNGGKHLLWIDPARDLVIASHWGDDIFKLVKATSDAIAVEFMA